MNKLLTAMLAGLLVASAAFADVAPPKGFKRVAIDHQITTEKEYADYAFFTVIGNSKVTAVKLDPKTPIDILAKDRGGRFLGCVLVAVPKDAAKQFDGEKEFHAAIAASKVEGLVKAKNGFFTQTEVKDTEKRTTIVMEYKLDKIDAKDGIVLIAKKDEPKKDGKNPPENEDAPNALAPRGGLWVAGLAAFAAVMLGGLWFVGRGRRKV